MNASTPVWAQHVSRVAVLSGAGVSTASGIPDYRGPDGVWTRDPSAAEAFTYRRFMADAQVRARFWRTYVDHAAWGAEPNPAHRAIASLDRPGLALRVLTQNIDGLQQRAGLAERKVLELHGTMHRTDCTGCRRGLPTTEVRVRVAAGETDPRCTACGGILKLGTVLFGEELNARLLGDAAAIVSASQLVIAAGSSLIVNPVASLCALAVDRGAQLVIINRDPTPYDAIAAEVIREDLVTALPRVAALLTTAPARA
ncbi:SIR2 family NAD-dependent protein deacylase [Catenuloplanes indicus]|uniref:protein acetyllysine N-acetyltransferase n=1 Tax=Catenuloplanes indicus TaxID=137267 RepID=A0AAE3VXG1_9ACTN|nr:Sir2 family NAD-dependent protein deacetylase [Catenuloplanes indicus]MDQ0365514.1 NAD-dependent deacetylase [Catenuloplanes indicus]